MTIGKFEKTADQKKALLLLGDNARYTLLFGGSRSGKTFILIYAMIVRALKAPGSRHAALRFRSNAVRQAILQDTFPKVMRLCFPGLSYRENSADSFVALPNGSEIWFFGLDTNERVEKILGREFATLYFNECSEISYSAVMIALTRLAQKSNLRNKAYFDCNPAGKSHWCYKLFISKLDPETNVPLPLPENYTSMLLNPDGNTANLPEGYISETLAGLSERRRRRFLNGCWLDDLDGALWKRAMIDSFRVVNVPLLSRIVIGVDPAVSSGRNSDETGIIAAGLGGDGHYYVLNDVSLRGSPLKWAQAVCCEYRHWLADRVVAEVNNGGDLIAANLRRVDQDIPCKAVRAAHGKITRAEPVAALYEQGKVHHVGKFVELEDQLCSYCPATATYSPDRLDALVWALSELSSLSSAPRIILA